MLFEFPVMTEEELTRINLLDPGMYDFHVIDAVFKSSSAGNQMVRLFIGVWDINGHEHTILDYLVRTEKMLYKTKHFCESVGLDYGSGKFDTDECLGKCGKVEIIIVDTKPDGKGGHYPAKNAVKDYIKLDPNSVEHFKNNKPINNSFDDAIPF
jgi:hypothetical protein